MAVAVKKYNPGFLTDDEIIESFCVRTAEFESIVESLREMGSSSSTHSLVIGPRGSGKTHLLLRVAAAVRRDPVLSGIFPVVFTEESYEVATCGEFWLECIAHLAEQAPSDDRDSLRLSYEDLRTVADDRELADRCLGSLLDFADRYDSRLLLVVENLNMLFSDMNDSDVGWRLRKTLQTEPRIILLASATSRFDEIDSPEHALYDLFRVLTLRPLDTAECEALWEAVSGKPPVGDTVRPLEILTGGSPRLIAIIARFGTDRSFADLMDNLLDLVDEHTEYFKSHLEALPPQERRVYLALARLWRPSTAREVADLARLDTNACSAQLRRLVERGIVAIEGGTPRRRQYYLTERLYNIYYLLRRGGGEDRLVKALIEFMICLYSPAELEDIVKISLQNAYVSGLLGNVPGQMADVLISEAQILERDGRDIEALEIYDQVIHGLGYSGTTDTYSRLSAALLHKSLLLIETGQAREALTVCDDLLDLVGTRRDGAFSILFAFASLLKGFSQLKVGDLEDALYTCNQALSSIGEVEATSPVSLVVALIVQAKGLILAHSNRPVEALTAFDEIVRRIGPDPEPKFAVLVAMSLALKALILASMGETISESEISLMLACVPDPEDLPRRIVDAMGYYVVGVGPARALELIQESPAAQILLPLVTALQQELGQTPQVAKEVQEIAQDIRRKLAELQEQTGAGGAYSQLTLYTPTYAPPAGRPPGTASAGTGLSLGTSR